MSTQNPDAPTPVLDRFVITIMTAITGNYFDEAGCATPIKLNSTTDDGCSATAIKFRMSNGEELLVAITTIPKE